MMRQIQQTPYEVKYPRHIKRLPVFLASALSESSERGLGPSSYRAAALDGQFRMRFAFCLRFQQYLTEFSIGY